MPQNRQSGSDLELEYWSFTGGWMLVLGGSTVTTMSAEKHKEPDAKDAKIAAATHRAQALVSDADDRAGDNTPTKPGTEAAKASAGTNETRETNAPQEAHVEQGLG